MLTARTTESAFGKDHYSTGLPIRVITSITTMNFSIATVVVMACTLAASAGASSNYDYNFTDQDRGPAHWFDLTEVANNTCGGERQSPIDIETRLPETSGCDLYKDYIFMVSSALSKRKWVR